MLALGVLLFLSGEASLELKIMKGNEAVAKVLPAVCMQPVDLDAEGIEVVCLYLAEDLLSDGITADIEDLP